jgi:hypothetical protein
MFVKLYIYIYEQYNPETAHRNILKLNILFQLKKRNTYQNKIDNLGLCISSLVFIGW